MFSTVLDFFFCQPRRIVALGRVLYRTGSFLIVAGLIGRVATVNIAAMGSSRGHQVVERSLMDIYPALPTWWVPESAFGYTVGAALLLLGVVVTITGWRWERLAA